MQSHGGAWDVTTSVGSTAVMVAAIRAVETARPGSLIHDPYARVLVTEADSGSWDALLGDSLAAMRESANRDTVALFDFMLAYLATRTHFFDSYLTDAVANGIRQVVILAAGLDSRAYRLSWPAGTTVYEIDQPRVLAYKSTTLAKHGVNPSAEHRRVPVDLRQDWATPLKGAGFDPESATAWLAEGLLVYLTTEGRGQLFEQMTRLSGPGSKFAADTVASSRDPRRRAIWERFVEVAGELGVHQTVNIGDLVHHDGEPSAAVERLNELGWRAALKPTRPEMRKLGRWVDVPGADDEELYGAFLAGERV